jgi:hypothetical protein
MSLISDYANQTVSLERKESTNDYGDTTYADAESILAVYELASGLRRSLTGDEVAVESRVLTETAVALGDRIEGSSVRRVVPVIDFDGETIGYEAFL